MRRLNETTGLFGGVGVTASSETTAGWIVGLEEFKDISNRHQ